MPFHNVNSPLLDPVNNLRPSGVHYSLPPLLGGYNTLTTLTGCLILLVEVWTYFIVIEVDGFRYAFVGSIYKLTTAGHGGYIDDIVETWSHGSLIVLGSL